MTARRPAHISARLQDASSNRAGGPSVSAPRGGSGLGFAALAALLGLMMLPLATIMVLGATSTTSVWSHLSGTVLPRALWQTATLMLGVGALTLVTGTATAWLVTMYRFPGRDLVDRLLIMPLAIPTYIVAYCYVELLDATGPLQTLVRTLGGFETARQYWFPEIRSTGGAVFVMSAVLYPYVYLSARASFVQQSVCALEVARTLGRTENGTLWAVALPMARPALIAGVALALMECLNDIGAVEYLGVETLTATVYATWVERESLGGAAQIATVMLVFVFALFTAERMSRGRAMFHHTTGRYRPISFARLEGVRGWLACAACLTPFAVGFAVPMVVLIENAWTAGLGSLDGRFRGAVWSSLTLAALAALVTVAIGLVMAHIRRTARMPQLGAAIQLAGIGYAIPGTVLAIGLMIPLAALDIRIGDVAQSIFGITTGQVLAGTSLTLVIAYAIRFAAISFGTIDAGFQRISPNVDAAARTLGETKFSTLARVHLPILLPALGAAALMVFVDTMKELPATLLLHPFNTETLATMVYAKAAAFEFGEAAIAALAIVATGLLPVLLLHQTIARGRPGDI
ncbi:MAG: iron ABC transporter permease [Hyphomicrobiaceae bacterium]|nr:iron ABC transporter permease [Hyphomicrobiaceae bacterium]